MRNGVLLVAVAGQREGDAAGLRALAPGARLVVVDASRADLERLMDAVEQQLVVSGELDGFVQMAPDGFRGVVRVVVDAPVPALLAWARARLAPGRVEVEHHPAC